MKMSVKKVLCMAMALTLSLGAACGVRPNSNPSGGGQGGYSSSQGGADSSSSQGGGQTGDSQSSTGGSQGADSSTGSSTADSSSSSQGTPFLENGMPDYDNITGVEDLMLNSYYSPIMRYEQFELYKACGFNWMNLWGNCAFPSSEVATALGWCDQLGLKTLVNASNDTGMMDDMANEYTQYDSFQGFYFDEPFMEYHDTKPGLIQLENATNALISASRDTSFCVNLNPIWFIDTFHLSYTYEDYVLAMMSKINQPYQDANSKARKWLSADDYPFWINKNTNEKWLAEDWLKGLSYLSVAKMESDMDNLTSNYFLQAMPFTSGSNKTRERTMTYKEMKMQMYTLLAFGYDSVSFFCYGTPPVGPEFTTSTIALVDRNGNTTTAYNDAKKLMTEVKKFSHTYMQFNDNWSGIYPVAGTNASGTRADFTLLEDWSDVEQMGSPLISSRRMGRLGLTSATATQDAIIGCMEDNYGNGGFMVVNYNDTVKNLGSTVTMNFDSTKFDSAWVYIDGVQTEVALTGGKLTLQLDVGEGVFVIPVKKA